MKPFILFTGSVCLLTLVGLTTIWYNIVSRGSADVKNGGITGLNDWVKAMFLHRAELGFTFWTYFDMILI